MYEPHPHLETPPDNTTVWRFMSLEKYLSLLTTSKLYFCRLDKLEDPWEGTYPKEIMDWVKNNVPEKQKAGIDRYFESHVKIENFVSCWHANEHESAAMWDLYGSRHSAVAIRSTIGRIKASVNDGVRTFIGRAIYHDRLPVRDGMISGILPVFFKRPSFMHENEIRILRQYQGYLEGQEGVIGALDESKAPGFMACVIDLAALCERVYFSPLMPKWLAESLTKISLDHGVHDYMISQSDLYSPYMG
jgi:hypothetical protein